MSFNWIDFIKLAKRLVENQDDEASLRSGISRAYYGVFCIARNKAGLKNYKKADVHREVIKCYRNSGSCDEAEAGVILDQMRKERNIADYDEDKEIKSELAKRVLLKAEKILKKLGVKI